VRTIVKGRNLDVTELDRRYVEEKLHRLERILDDRTDAVAELGLEHHRNAEESRIVELSLWVDGRPLRAVAHAASWRAATDEAVDHAERLAVALHEKPRDLHRSPPRKPGGGATPG